MTTKPVPALGAPMSPAWVHGSPRVEDLALPKSLKSCNFPLVKAVIRGCRFRQERQERRARCRRRPLPGALSAHRLRRRTAVLLGFGFIGRGKHLRI
jgi:hypothetical protein